MSPGLPFPLATSVTYAAIPSMLLDTREIRFSDLGRRFSLIIADFIRLICENLR